MKKSEVIFVNKLLKTWTLKTNNDIIHKLQMEGTKHGSN